MCIPAAQDSSRWRKQVLLAVTFNFSSDDELVHLSVSGVKSGYSLYINFISPEWQHDTRKYKIYEKYKLYTDNKKIQR